jgi:hypothetical protein
MEGYRQSEEYYQHFSKKGWAIEKIGSTNVQLKRIPWVGSIVVIKRCPENPSLTEIEDYSIHNKALLTIVDLAIATEDSNYTELEKLFISKGFNDIDLFLSPTKTSYIDLSRSESELLAGFDGEICRSIRINFDNHIVFKTTSGIGNFYPLLLEAAHRGNYYIQNQQDWTDKWKPFGDQIRSIFAYLDGELVGGNMSIIKSPFASGLFLPTTELGRSKKVAASLIWEGFKQAKNAGCVSFDLDGLYDERYKSPKKWLGLTAFKKQFGGHDVGFMHPKVKIYSKYIKPFERFIPLWMFILQA